MAAIRSRFSGFAAAAPQAAAAPGDGAKASRCHAAGNSASARSAFSQSPDGKRRTTPSPAASSIPTAGAAPSSR